MYFKYFSLQQFLPFTFQAKIVIPLDTQQVEQQPLNTTQMMS